MIRVLIVDDSRQSQFFLKTMLAQSTECTIVDTIASAANAELYCLGNRIDLILMDICTADNASGLAAAEKIKKNYPGVKIVMVTSMPEYSFIGQAKCAGCEGFWYKEYGDTELLDVVQRVMSGEKCYPEEAPVIPVGLANSKDFSDREYEIVRMLADGLNRQEIADKLGISARTVRFYIEELKTKTGHEDTMKMVAAFVEQKLIINNLQ
ncbi:MAG: response regulator transcription factor [Acetatifactor sp.]|nr:response regulator transcription factor [Acetatifactor sp.]